MSPKAGKAPRVRRTFVRRSEGRPQPNAGDRRRSEAKSAHDRTRTCTPFPAPVPQTGLSTNSSTWATPAVAQGGDEMLEEGLEPSRG